MVTEHRRTVENETRLISVEDIPDETAGRRDTFILRRLRRI